VTLAFLFGLVAYGSLRGRTGLPPPLLLLASAVIVAPLALLPARPLLGWRIAWVGALLTGLGGPRAEPGPPWPWQPVQIILLAVLLFAVGLRHPRGVLVWTWVSAALLVAVFVTSNNTPGLLLAITAIAVIADQIRRRREAPVRSQSCCRACAARPGPRSACSDRTAGWPPRWSGNKSAYLAGVGSMGQTGSLSLDMCMLGSRSLDGDQEILSNL